MSWLTDLTSKAETFLNKIDQSAAVKFNESDISGSTSSIIDIRSETQTFIPTNIPSDISPPTTPSSQIKKPVRSPKNSPTLIIKSHSSTDVNSTVNSDRVWTEDVNKVKTTRSPSLKKQDEMLFEFLNNPNPATTKSPKSSKSSTPRRTSPVPTIIPLENTSHIQSVEVNLSTEDPGPADTPPKNLEEPASDKVEYVETKNTQGDLMRQHDGRMSNLELENQLLKNEMQGLNEELVRNLNRLKEQQEETEKYKLRYENRRNQQNEDYERIRYEYENKEGDLQEVLRAKDSQLAVLRVRIQEVDLELKEKSKMLLEVQNHNEQLMKDHTDASGVQNVALDSIRDKLEETESQLQKEQYTNTTIKSELLSLQEKLCSEQNQYAETIKLLEMKKNQGKEKFREFETKVKQAEGDSVDARKELNDYKEKATRILQAKEKLITSLKQSAGGTDLPPMLFTELEEVKQERDMMREEYIQYKYKTEQLRSEYQELELLHNTDLEDNHQKVESLQLSLQDEATKRQHAEEDIKRYMQELQLNKEELHKIRKSNNAQNQQHEAELKKLQNQIAVKKNVSSSQEELENRIRTLTDSLIHKQTVVETLSTEKNSLVLQLERLEKQYYDIQKSLDVKNKKRNPNDTDELDEDGRLQSMYSIMPSQIVQNRRWKTTVNEIDKCSVRFGVFLRRYPAARLMVLVYMLLLHIWVTFVLLTYTPEIHPKEKPA